MSSIDDAWLDTMVLLRPHVSNPGESRPCAAVAVRMNPPPALVELLMRSYLTRGWELVAAPVGHFEPTGTRLAHIQGDPDGSLRVLAADRRGRLTEDMYYDEADVSTALCAAWPELARAQQHAVALLVLWPTSTTNAASLDEAARAGRVLGARATISIPNTWATPPEAFQLPS